VPYRFGHQVTLAHPVRDTTAHRPDAAGGDRPVVRRAGMNVDGSTPPTAIE
jgi:hypothetical protein